MVEYLLTETDKDIIPFITCRKEYGDKTKG